MVKVKINSDYMNSKIIPTLLASNNIFKDVAKAANGLSIPSDFNKLSDVMAIAPTFETCYKGLKSFCDWHTAITKEFDDEVTETKYTLSQIDDTGVPKRTNII